MRDGETRTRLTGQVEHMTKQKPLKPEDFPVSAHDKIVSKEDGKPIATATDNKTAQDVADRLNADEARSEEDRWS